MSGLVGFFSPGAEVKPTSFRGLLPAVHHLLHLLFPASKTFTCAHREARCCSLTAVHPLTYFGLGTLLGQLVLANDAPQAFLGGDSRR